MHPGLIAITLVAFVDLLGFSIVLPLTPFYADRYGADDVTIGLLISSYALAQFLFTPTLGSLADRYGRKPVLLLSMLGTILGFLLWAHAEPLGSLFFDDPARGALALLFAARILDGITGGNVAVVQAYIADLTDKANRSRGLGLVGAAFGLGFIMGPPLGGFLSRNGDYALPALVAAGIAAVNWIAVAVFLPETRVKREGAALPRRSTLPWRAIREVGSRPFLGSLLTTVFVYSMAFGMFTSVFSLFTMRRFGLASDLNGYILGFAGIFIVLVQGGLIGPLTRRFGEIRLVQAALPGIALGLLVWGTAPTLALMIAAIVPCSLFGGTLNVSLRSLVSQSVDEDELGEVMGVQASVESLTRGVAPILGAWLIEALGTSAPGLYGFVTLSLLALVMAPRLSRRA